MKLSQPHHISEVISRAAQIMGTILDDPTELGEHRAQLSALLPWLGLERFDRRAVNQALNWLTHIERSAA